MLGLAAGVELLGGCRTRATTKLPAVGPPAEPSRLAAPREGRIPAAFVIGKDAEVLDFTGPLEVFAGAALADGPPLFAPFTVAASSEPVVVGGGLRVVPDHSFANAPAPKVVVIPAMDLAAADDAMLAWIRRVSASTDLTMSVCNGGFVLARTGLLDGRQATVHHGAYFTFAAAFPAVHLRRGARFVEDGNLASAGGVSSGIDLALRVVERYVGRDGVLALADAIEYQGQGWLDPDANHAYARLPALTGPSPRCPVCLADVDERLAETHRGTTYFFCSNGCRELFRQHTDVLDRFVAEDAAKG